MSDFVKGEPQTDAALASANVRTNLDALFEGDIEPLRVRAQVTPDMTVAVEDDNGRSYVVGNTPLDFAGDDSPSFTAPLNANEKQIDILTLDNAGTLAIISGTPTTGTPAAPSYPSNKIVVAEIYLRNGMASIKNTDDATNGYIFKARSPILNLGGGWNKGADIASAAALPLGDDGNYFDVTGTTTITSISTKGTNFLIKLHFDSALTLTHHATDLVLPGGNDVNVKAGQEYEFFEYASGDWRLTGSGSGGSAADFAAGDVPVASSLPETTDTTASYVKQKSISLGRGGTLRIKFDLNSGGGGPALGKIYRNGGAVGSEKSESGSSYVTQSEDIAGWSAGDTCELWLNHSSEGTVNARRLILYSDTAGSQENVSIMDLKP